jgi:hypothetical protein
MLTINLSHSIWKIQSIYSPQETGFWEEVSPRVVTCCCRYFKTVLKVLLGICVVQDVLDDQSLQGLFNMSLAWHLHRWYAMFWINQSLIGQLGAVLLSILPCFAGSGRSAQQVLPRNSTVTWVGTWYLFLFHLIYCFYCRQLLHY